MIEKSELLRRTGLSAKQLEYLRTLRLVRVQERGNAPGWGGSRSYYPDEALAIIRGIQALQDEGLSLPQIAEHMRGSKVALAVDGQFADGTKAERLDNPDHIKTMFALMADIKAAFGAETLIRIEFEHEERDGQWILRAPVVIYK